jgi:hypothetical protein
MLRPTPGRLLYLLIGLVIGIIGLFAYTSVAGTPAFVPSFRPTPVTQNVPAAFTGVTLGKIVPAMQLTTKAGVVVRVNTVEEFADGFSLTYSIVSGQPGEPAPVLQPERFDIVDDRGASYHLSVVGSSSTPGPGLTSGYLAFTPALSPDAKTLTISVPHLLMISSLTETGSPRVLDGPWQLQVPLH